MSNQSKSDCIWKPWWAPAVIALIILIGYHKMFFGCNVFTHEDWIALSNHTFGNKFSNGWRPDKGLGLSNFYGDPGLWHPWSMWSWLERISPSRILAYHSAILILDLWAAFSIYLFTRRMLPAMNLWAVILLSPTIVFCFNQPGEHFSRNFTSVLAGSVLIIWLLYEYYRRPRWIHLFAAALLFWSAAFFGNLWALSQVMTFGVVLTFCYRFYFQTAWKEMVQKFLLIYAAAGAMFLGLGAYVFYSFGLEQTVTEFVREKPHLISSIQWLPDLKNLMAYLVCFMPFYGLPVIHDLAGLVVLPYYLNVSPLFIFVFLYFISKKADNFWELALKAIAAVFFIHGLCVYGKLVPGYYALYNFLTNTSSKLIAMYDFPFAAQTLLIIYFIAVINPADAVIKSRFFRRIQMALAGGTVVCYLGVLVLAVLSRLAPHFYLRLADTIIPSFLPSHLGGYSKELLAEMMSYNARRYQEIATPTMTAFYALTIVTVGVFLKDSWLRKAAGLNKIVLSAIILINGLLISWALSPLSNRPWIWEEPQVKALAFEPTDRFYFFRKTKWEKTVEGFRRKWLEVGDGHREARVGYLEPPGLNISGFRSFNSKAEYHFMKRVFDEAGIEYQRLYYGTYLLTSDLLDMAAVKYYYSDGPIENLPARLVPYAHFPQLFIYKNTAAWPYYYLARKLDVDNGRLEHPVEGTAYLRKDDLFALPSRAGEGAIKMTDFERGRFQFHFDSPREEILVIADSWHPFWKARAQGRQLPVIKANEVFKGIKLPPGRYDVDVYFDAAPYQKGIGVSVICWILFLTGFIIFGRNQKPIPFLEVHRA